MDHELVPEKQLGGTRSYIIGFVLSLLFTLASYLVATRLGLGGQAFVIAIMTLALVQAAIQLYFFLHVGQEKHPRWSTLVFAMTVMVVLALMIGTLWIMNNLNSRVMPAM
jgi:cytochrome o ubiquinol oxidase subunit IV